MSEMRRFMAAGRLFSIDGGWLDFRVDVDRLVVRFSVGVVRPVSQVQRNVQEVCDF